MRYIKLFENFSLDMKNYVETHIIDLIDKGFTVVCDFEDNETYSMLEITIRTPFNYMLSYDEQDKYFISDIKDNIVMLLQSLEDEFIVNEISLRLYDDYNNGPYIFDNIKQFDKLNPMIDSNGEDYDINGSQVSDVTLYLLKNK